MSALLKDSLRMLTKAFDYTQSGMTPMQFATTHEVLRAVADEEREINADIASAMARELGWSFRCARMLKDFAGLVNSGQHVLPPFGSGIGFEIVRLNKMDHRLETARSQTLDQLARVASMRGMMEPALEQTVQAPETATDNTSETAPDEDRPDLLTLLVLIGAVIALVAFLHAAKPGDSIGFGSPSVGNG